MRTDDRFSVRGRREPDGAGEAGTVEGDTAEDVVLGGLEAGEVEGLEDLDQHRDAGDDRGRPVGVQAADAAQLGQGQAGQAGEQ